jgi:hypothetical protein
MGRYLQRKRDDQLVVERADMIERDDISTRLSRAEKAAEEFSKGQTYNFTSLISKRSINAGTFDYTFSHLAPSSYFKVVATPASGRLMPINIDVRFRVGNSDVVGNPDYETTDRFINRQAKLVTDDGVHRIDCLYSSTVNETVYIKVFVTGMDDYTITVTAL